MPEVRVSDAGAGDLFVMTDKTITMPSVEAQRESVISALRMAIEVLEKVEGPSPGNGNGSVPASVTAALNLLSERITTMAGELDAKLTELRADLDALVTEVDALAARFAAAGAVTPQQLAQLDSLHAEIVAQKDKVAAAGAAVPPAP